MLPIGAFVATFTPSRKKKRCRKEKQKSHRLKKEKQIPTEGDLPLNGEDGRKESLPIHSPKSGKKGDTC